MVKKFVYGTPFETEAVVKEIPSSEGNPDYGTFSTENGFSFTTKLADDDMVFGLGEANRCLLYTSRVLTVQFCRLLPV